MAGCPTNRDAKSGGIPSDQWGNAQWANEIWVDTGYTIDGELDNVYTEFEDCEAFIFVDENGREDLSVETHRHSPQNCPAPAATDFILTGDFWKLTRTNKYIINTSFMKQEVNAFVTAKECVKECRRNRFCITVEFKDAANEKTCTLYSQKVFDILNTNIQVSAETNIWEKQYCNSQYYIDCGWKPGRFKKEDNQWHTQINDQLSGTAVNFGDPTQTDNDFNVLPNDNSFNQFMFTTLENKGNGIFFAVVSRGDVTGGAPYNVEKMFIRSSEDLTEQKLSLSKQENNPSTSTFIWKINDNVYYAENGYSQNIAGLTGTGGAGVLTRNAPDPNSDLEQCLISTQTRIENQFSELSQNPILTPKGKIKIHAAQISNYVSQTTIKLQIKYRDTLTKEIFDGIDRKILVNVGGPKNSCGSETISNTLQVRDFVFHKQNQIPVELPSTFKDASSDQQCGIIQMFIKIHSYNGQKPIFQPKWEQVELDITLPPGDDIYTQVEIKLVSKGGKQRNIGFSTIAICGDETISSVPIEKFYKLTNSNQKLSWDDSERIVATLDGRLPTVDEVRHIIATKAGTSQWSKILFSQDPAKTDGQLVSSVQFIACGNSTNKQWISIGAEYTYNGEKFYPGMTANLGREYPSWGDKYNIFDNNNQGMTLSQQQTKAQQLGGRLATKSEIEKFVTEKALKTVYDSGVYETGYLTQGIRLTACTQNEVLKWCSIGMKSVKDPTLIYPGSISDSFYCASGQINNNAVLNPVYIKSCDEISMMLWISNDQDQWGETQSWHTYFMNIIHNPPESLQTQTSQVIKYRNNLADFQEITASEMGFFFSIGTAANSAHIYCGDPNKMVYSLYIDNNQNMNNLADSEIALLQWNPSQPTYNSMISYDSITNSIKIEQTKGQTVSFIIRAETMGLKRAHRKVVVQLVDCIGQQLLSLHPEGLVLNYYANNGTYLIPKSEFEYNKLFSWSEPLCPVTTMIYQKSPQSTTDIFALEWLKLDDQGLIINTDKFLQLNRTYIGEIVGQVEVYGGKKVRTVIKLNVTVPWLKPKVDFGAQLQSQRAEQIKVDAEKKKTNDENKAVEQEKKDFQKFLQEAQIVLQQAVKVGFITKDEAQEIYNAVEAKEISQKDLQEKKKEFDVFQEQQRVKNQKTKNIEESKVQRREPIINQTRQNQTKKQEEEKPKPVEKAVLTQTIQQQAESDLAEYPKVKEQKPVDAPVAASKDHVDNLFNGWMTQTVDNKPKHKNNGFVPPPPQMLEPLITRDGYLNFPFDQEMQVPDFIAQKGQSTTGPNGRRLVALDEIDVSRDILDLQFLLKSDQNPSDIKYYMQIDAWTPRHLSILVNFTDPTIISKGQDRDTMYIKLKNSNMFKSAETGLSLDISNGILKQTIPRQLPKNVDRVELEGSAQSAKDAVAGIVYAQILFQIFAKKYKGQMAATFFCIQLCTFFTIFTIPIPSNAEIYLDQFRGLINFSMVNPNVIMGMVIKDFDINKLMGIEKQKMTASEESSSMESTNFWANMSTFIFMFVIVIFIVFFAIILVVFCHKSIANNVKSSLIQFKNDTFFGNSIKAQSATYLKTTISFCVFFRTINFNASTTQVILSCSPLMLIIVYPIAVTFILFCMKDKLGVPKIRDSIGQFYNAVDLKKGSWALIYYPITLLRRLLFVIVPYVASQYPWNQVQLLISINFVFSMYYIGVRPHMGGDLKFYLETHNECIIIILCYHMFTFTDLVPQSEYRAVFSMGASFTLLIAEILISNLIVLFYEISQQTSSARRKEKRQQEYESRFRQFQNLEKLIYLEKMSQEQNKRTALNQKRAEIDLNTQKVSETITNNNPFGRINMPFQTIQEFSNEDSEDDDWNLSPRSKNKNNATRRKEVVYPALNLFNLQNESDMSLDDAILQYEVRKALQHFDDKQNATGAEDLFAATNFKYGPLENSTIDSSIFEINDKQKIQKQKQNSQQKDS